MRHTAQNKKVYTEPASPDRSGMAEGVHTSDRGFTIIELLVVMAIIGILMMVGINAFVSTRRSREVADVTANVRGLVKTAREMALSVAGADNTNKWPVAYEVEILGSSATLYIYYSKAEQYEKWAPLSSSFDKVVNSTVGYGNVLITNQGCNRVVFSSVSGDMSLYKNGASVLSNCKITFSAGDRVRNLTLNAGTKTFEIN